ncbi:MAG: spore maturation protein [Bacteroidaceae bacterium]|nr:spore maturation protein [Bacteroidaceae bacterium]MBR1755003.1 spore maturation protein [Bacteroidaceae bacterium]
MALNYIWIAFFLIAAAVAVVKLVFFGDVEVFPAIMNATMDSAKNGFEISLGLTAVLSLWMGIMKVGEQGGVVNLLARWLGPLFRRLFPEIPEGHPVVGNIFMNLSANMLGLDNAATPLGLKAMEGLEEIKNEDLKKMQEHGEIDENQFSRLRHTASNSMIMFMVLNTAGLTIVPVSILAYRATMGAAQPTDIFVPILLATMTSTVFGVILTSLIQRINLLNRPVLLTLALLSLLVAGMAWASQSLSQSEMGVFSANLANIILLGIIVAFILAGVRKRINVYDAFIEGAKGGFSTAVGIIPYLIAILVGIGVFRASGAMDWLLQGIGWVVEVCGGNADITGALPTALMKPLSGSGARGMMLECMQTYGPDSFAGRLSCIFQGSTDTTFYILAVYFGSVGIRNTRYALPCGLAADFASMVAAIIVAQLFFG